MCGRERERARLGRLVKVRWVTVGKNLARAGRGVAFVSFSFVDFVSPDRTVGVR